VCGGYFFPFHRSPPLIVSSNVNIQPLICFSNPLYYFLITFLNDRGFLSIGFSYPPAPIGVSYRKHPLHGGIPRNPPPPIGFLYRSYIFFKSNFPLGERGMGVNREYLSYHITIPPLVTYHLYLGMFVYIFYMWFVTFGPKMS